MLKTILSVFVVLTFIVKTISQPQILNTENIIINMPENSSKLTIIYAFDPLCGWCYGFSPVIEKFMESNPYADIKIVPGGMVTGDRIGPIGEVAGYISWAYKDVEKATGVEFGEKFLNGTMKEGTAIFTSIPLSKAMAVINNSYPDKALEAGGLLHKAVYYEGLKPMDNDLYIWLADNLEIDGKWLLSEMDKAETENRMNEDFQLSSALGVNGFPSLILTNGEKYVKFGSGYMPYQNLESNFNSAKNMLSE